MTPEQHDALTLKVAKEVYDCAFDVSGQRQRVLEFARRLREEWVKELDPVAWEYTSKITSSTMVTHQPPDRVIEVDQFVIKPLYTIEVLK